MLTFHEIDRAHLLASRLSYSSNAIRPTFNYPYRKQFNLNQHKQQKHFLTYQWPSCAVIYM